MEEYSDTERLLRLLFMQADLIDELLAEKRQAWGALRPFQTSSERRAQQKILFESVYASSGQNGSQAARMLGITYRQFKYHWDRLHPTPSQKETE